MGEFKQEFDNKMESPMIIDDSKLFWARQMNI